MADPISLGTMAAVSMGTSAAGGILGAFGASSAADASQNMYNYKAGVAQANAVVAHKNAEYATQVGGVKAEQVGIEGGQRLGMMEAIQGASGIDVNSGTAVTVREDQQKAIAQSEGIIRNDAARKAYGYEVEGVNFKSEGELDIAAGKNAETAGDFNIASSLLGGATSVADKWSKYKSAGVFV